jgi:hypothetical protein
MIPVHSQVSQLLSSQQDYQLKMCLHFSLLSNPPLTEERYWALFYMPLYTSIHVLRNLLNVLVQTANNMGLQKKISVLKIFHTAQIMKLCIMHVVICRLVTFKAYQHCNGMRGSSTFSEGRFFLGWDRPFLLSDSLSTYSDRLCSAHQHKSTLSLSEIWRAGALVYWSVQR